MPVSKWKEREVHKDPDRTCLSQLVMSVILLLDLIQGSGQRRGIIWTGTRAWGGDVDKDSESVLGDRKAGTGMCGPGSTGWGWCPFGAGHIGTRIRMTISSS